MLAVMSEIKKSIQGREELEYIGLLCSSRFVLVRVTSSISPRFVLRPTPGSPYGGEWSQIIGPSHASRIHNHGVIEPWAIDPSSPGA